MLAIDVRSLAKTYPAPFGGRPLEALAGVDLSVERGAAFGLIGMNGAGKTTFIKSLLGIVRPTSGTVRVLGGDPEEPATRARIGYLPERLELPHAWTPRDFLASVARLKGLGRGSRRGASSDEADRLLDRVGLVADAERKIGGFSKGMKQRLGLAATLLGDPDLLVLDEPTDGIDPLGRVEIRRLLEQERARGATVFLNSHLLSETERICDRIGILARGRLARCGPLDELCGDATAFRVRLAAPIDRAALDAAGLTETDQPLVYRCRAEDPEALNRTLDAARAAGALFVELTRELRQLEDVLAEVAQA